jgi:hypothetical protein
MNKQELEQDLKTLGVKPDNYTLNGPPYKDSSWVLEAVNAKKSIGVWRVFNFERGKIYDEKVFNTEDEACKYIYEKLRKHHELFKKFRLNN